MKLQKHSRLENSLKNALAKVQNMTDKNYPQNDSNVVDYDIWDIQQQVETALAEIEKLAEETK